MKINRGAIGDDAHAAAELSLGIKILEGDHGFGKRFTKDTPCRIVVPFVEREAKISEQAIAEARHIAKGREDLKVIVLE